jgi:hypothetical protein
MAAGLVTLFLCGDVMLGRGVDQVLPHPGDPQLRETYARDARAYVRLAERANGPVPQSASFCWPWGDALAVLDQVAPDARVINLETSVTRTADFAPGKAIHYRMSPDNLPAVTAARPDACALANNHVLDFGRTGLTEPSARWPAPGCRPWEPGGTSPRPGGQLPSRYVEAAAPSSSPAGPPPAAFGPAGPRPPPGRASICCPACPALPPKTPSPECRPSGNPVTSWSCPSTGAPTGGTAWPMTRSASPIGSSTPAPT